MYHREFGDLEIAIKSHGFFLKSQNLGAFQRFLGGGGALSIFDKEAIAPLGSRDCSLISHQVYQ
jgi:hypothetical protein